MPLALRRTRQPQCKGGQNSLIKDRKKKLSDPSIKTTFVLSVITIIYSVEIIVKGTSNNFCVTGKDQNKFGLSSQKRQRNFR
jgi:hypothetical protein